MPSRAQFEKLTRRIDEMMARIDPAPPVVSIMHPASWSAEKVEALRERHYARYPSSRRAGLIVLLKWFHDDPDHFGRSWEGSTPRDANCLDDVTWRELAREWRLPVTSDEDWEQFCSKPCG